LPKWKNDWDRGKKDFAERRTDGGKGTADFRPGRRGFRDAGGDGETAEHRAGAAKGQGAKGTAASRTGVLFPARRAASCPVRRAAPLVKPRLTAARRAGLFLFFYRPRVYSSCPRRYLLSGGGFYRASQPPAPPPASSRRARRCGILKA
jgi:hypothetical protein